MAALLGGAALALASALPAGAITVQVNDTFSGNDCSGEFGQGFENCKIPSAIDPDQSPIIIKFNFNNGVPGLVELNLGLFPSIDGTEFFFSFPDVGATGIWTYTPGLDDPDVTFWVAKGGPSFNLFTDDSGDPVTTGTWFTPLVGNNGGNPSALSHISLYDTGGGNGVPEPGTLLLAGAALAALGMMRRRRT
ncbi:MAG: PEP-CTERM sorting domain-containing protein [Burkholderiales bacterium]